MFVVFDIGGTKTRVAYSRDGQSFGEPLVFETERDFKIQVKKLKEAASHVSGDRDIKAMAGGVAGPFDETHSRLINSPNIPTWVGLPIKEELERAFSVPIFLENDSAMVGLGEASVGAGKDYIIVAYITVSTGVGGARIVGGEIDKKKIGFEPGHSVINFEGLKCAKCGRLGHLEAYVGGHSLEDRTGKKAYEIHDDDVWEEEARLLALGLNNVVVFWSPDVIVLGGSMIIGDPAISVEATRKYLKETLKIFPDIPEIKKAELGDFGGLHGALIYLKQYYNK
jgi:glucokinase